MSSKTVTILGSTGSIGKNTLDLVKHHPKKFKLRALTAFKNADLLIAQAIAFRPEMVAIGDPAFYEKVKAALAPHDIKVVAGEEGIIEAASLPVDISIGAIVGITGLNPLMAALGNAKVLAIANKEPLVAAGNIFLNAAKEKGTKILPLDSEHNAIFQVFEERNRSSVLRLILTASGGPFRTWSHAEMENATREQALKHPNWSMGSKITIDSATMMNKALEIIEAYYLFDMPASQIDVLIHPQSVVHSMVEYNDGSVLAQLGAPDMRTPIAYVLGWPERINTPGGRLDWSSLAKLEFEPVSFERFPAVKMAYECLEAGPAAQVAFNAANEVAVEAFLDGRISFNQILRIVGKILESQPVQAIHTLSDVIFLDKSVRERTKSYIIN